MTTITRVVTKQKAAALTFDDGPHPENTPRLLEVLDRHGAKGTFFMVGEAAARHPELVEQVTRAGHAVGNHSWDHPSLPELSSRERRRQLRSCREVLKPSGVKLFRPPFGYQTLSSWVDAFLLGYSVVAWNVHAEDWLDHPSDWMAQRLIHTLRRGSIVLLHDHLYHVLKDEYVDRSRMLRALDQFLRTMSREYRFVTVPELLKCGKPKRSFWLRPTDGKMMKQLKRTAIPHDSSAGTSVVS